MGPVLAEFFKVVVTEETGKGSARPSERRTTRFAEVILGVGDGPVTFHQQPAHERCSAGSLVRPPLGSEI